MYCDLVLLIKMCRCLYDSVENVKFITFKLISSINVCALHSTGAEIKDQIS